MGYHAFSAGIYSIKHFPRSTDFKKTNPSLNLSESHDFLLATCMSLLFEMAQQICSPSRFSFVTLTYSICFSLRFIATRLRYKLIASRPIQTTSVKTYSPQKVMITERRDRNNGFCIFRLTRAARSLRFQNALLFPNNRIRYKSLAVLFRQSKLPFRHREN